MNESHPGTAFRGLPLSTQQEREITHFIEACQRSGNAWDTPELAALIRDMLHPPERDELDPDLSDSITAECYIAAHEESADDGREQDRGGAPPH